MWTNTEHVLHCSLLTANIFLSNSTNIERKQKKVYFNESFCLLLIIIK